MSGRLPVSDALRAITPLLTSPRGSGFLCPVIPLLEARPIARAALSFPANHFKKIGFILGGIHTTSKRLRKSPIGQAWKSRTQLVSQGRSKPVRPEYPLQGAICKAEGQGETEVIQGHSSL